MTTATLEKIEDHIEADRLEEARQALDAITEDDENRTDLRYLRGYLQERAYDREGALEVYHQVLDLDPDHLEATFRAALLSDLLGADDTALKLYEKCAARRPAHVNALVNLAVLYEERGRLEQAEACLASVVAEHPNHRRATEFLDSVDSSYDMVYDERSLKEREHHSALLDTPISDFELSVRSRNCLRQMNIRTLGQLLRTSEAELLSYKNFGETSLNEIKAMLCQKNLTLGQGLQPADRSPLLARAPLADASASVNRLVSELELSVRSRKCLQSLGVATLGELAMRSEAELMATKNFGQTSLSEIKRQLAIYGLSFRS
ncbi:MAG: tetratricopeptide repeat protein [Planctomycetes bacterium]|nr:tetratricopeptide repeat protein [Planctomycetota bacterium]